MHCTGLSTGAGDDIIIFSEIGAFIIHLARILVTSGNKILLHDLDDTTVN
jgi:hypothetical protein